MNHCSHNGGDLATNAHKGRFDNHTLQDTGFNHDQLPKEATGNSCDLSSVITGKANVNNMEIDGFHLKRAAQEFPYWICKMSHHQTIWVDTSVLKS